MATFTGESRPFELLVEIPAACIQAPCVDQIAGRDRATGGTEAFLQIDEKRCKPTVEPDHDAVVAGPFNRFQDRGELLVGEC